MSDMWAVLKADPLGAVFAELPLACFGGVDEPADGGPRPGRHRHAC